MKCFDDIEGNVVLFEIFVGVIFEFIVLVLFVCFDLRLVINDVLYVNVEYIFFCFNRRGVGWIEFCFVFLVFKEDK